MVLKNKPAVFIDRDGTINEEMGYVNHLSRMLLLPRSGKAIRLLNKHNIPTIVVTNQSGVARGYFDEALISKVHGKLSRLLRKEGAHVDKIYYCPHHPTVGKPPYRKHCSCRKPQTGMLKKAAKDFAIDLGRSYIVGDRMKDIYFGHAAGLKAVLVLTGYGRGEFEHQKDSWEGEPQYVARDLYDAVSWILRDMGIKVCSGKANKR
jgi:D-glycero-D-manno-heptose 1,7-bisphosphate phosphatase